MKYAWLIARREYLENVRTKGFWIGMLLFPAMLLLFGSIPALLEKRATPVRYFVVMDASGAFDAAINLRLERFQQRRILRALNEYALKNARARRTTTSAADNSNIARAGIDLEKVPAPNADGIDGILEDFAESNPRALDEFAQRGGLTTALRMLKPYLREDAPEFVPPSASYQRIPLPALAQTNGTLRQLAESLRPLLRGEAKIEINGHREMLFAAILIAADATNRLARPGQIPSAPGPGQKPFEYWASNLADGSLADEIERAVNTEVRRREYIGRGLDPAVIAAVERTSLAMAKLNPKKAAGMEAVSMADYIRQWAPSGFVYLLWVAIFSVAQMLLNNTIEEKSNRIIEVLLSSVTPGELMMGKLLGIASVGLTMIGSWVGMLVGILVWKAGPEAEFARQLLTVLTTSNLLPAFGVYFLLGYLMYAGLILSLGSVCNTLKEAQNYMGVIIMILMVPLLTMMYIPKDPNGTLATVLSWIPLYTPFVMMNRATADPPLFDVVGTMVLLAASTAAVLWMSGRVFRVGILRTGQPPKWIELWRWIRERP